MPKVKVTALPAGGFRRCNMSFTREPKDVEVTAKQLEILKKEKNLVVMEIPEEPEEEKKDKKEKK